MKVTPSGSVPLSLSVSVGDPFAVTVKAPWSPGVNAACDELLIDGDADASVYQATNLFVLGVTPESE